MVMTKFASSEDASSRNKFNRARLEQRRRLTAPENRILIGRAQEPRIKCLVSANLPLHSSTLGLRLGSGLANGLVLTCSSTKPMSHRMLQMAITILPQSIKQPILFKTRYRPCMVHVPSIKSLPDSSSARLSHAAGKYRIFHTTSVSHGLRLEAYNSAIMLTGFSVESRIWFSRRG